MSAPGTAATLDRPWARAGAGLAAVACALALAACGGGGGDDERGSTAPVRLGIVGEAIDESFRAVARTVGRPGVPDSGVAVMDFTGRSVADDAGLRDSASRTRNAVTDSDIVVSVDGRPATEELLAGADTTKAPGDVATLVVVDPEGRRRTVEVPYVQDEEIEGGFVGG